MTYLQTDDLANTGFEGSNWDLVWNFMALSKAPYPDSLGFRDMRLHRMNVDLDKIDWDSNSVHWMKSGVYPPKVKWLYLAEQLPLPWQVKLIYAHLFWVLAKVA